MLLSRSEENVAGFFGENVSKTVQLRDNTFNKIFSRRELFDRRKFMNVLYLVSLRLDRRNVYQEEIDVG